MLNDKNQQFRPWPLSAYWDRKGKTIKEGRGSPVEDFTSNAGGTGSNPSLGAKIHMPHSQKTRAQNRSNTVTNTIKTFKKWYTHTHTHTQNLRKKKKEEEVRSQNLKFTNS